MNSIIPETLKRFGQYCLRLGQIFFPFFFFSNFSIGDPEVFHISTLFIIKEENIFRF